MPISSHIFGNQDSISPSCLDAPNPIGLVARYRWTNILATKGIGQVLCMLTISSHIMRIRIVYRMLYSYLILQFRLKIIKTSVDQVVTSSKTQTSTKSWVNVAIIQGPHLARLKHIWDWQIECQSIAYEVLLQTNMGITLSIGSRKNAIQWRKNWKIAID